MVLIFIVLSGNTRIFFKDQFKNTLSTKLFPSITAKLLIASFTVILENNTYHNPLYISPAYKSLWGGGGFDSTQTIDSTHPWIVRTSRMMRVSIKFMVSTFTGS